jgi:hypothetical protein
MDEGVPEIERVPGNLHYDLPFLPYIMERRKNRWTSTKTRTQPIRTLWVQPTKKLLSAHLISIESLSGENGQKPQNSSLLWHPLLLPSQHWELYVLLLFYLNK